MRSLREYVISEAINNDVVLRGGVYNDKDWSNLEDWVRDNTWAFGKIHGTSIRMQANDVYPKSNEKLISDIAEDLYRLAQEKKKTNAPKVTKKLLSYLINTEKWYSKLDYNISEK